MKFTKKRIALIGVPIAAFAFVLILAAVPVENNGIIPTSAAYTGFNAHITVSSHHFEDTAAPVSTRYNGNFNATCAGVAWNAKTQSPSTCASGWVYTEDPTTVMTNTGHDFWEYAMTGSCPAAITCTSADLGGVDDLMISTSSTTPAVTDTGCGGGSGSGQITTGGLADSEAGTITTPNAASGTVTITIANTWTAAETDTSIQNLCLNTELHTGSNVILMISGTFGPDTLVSGDTFTGTVSWTGT